jgi:hypothetical protein
MPREIYDRQGPLPTPAKFKSPSPAAHWQSHHEQFCYTLADIARIDGHSAPNLGCIWFPAQGRAVAFVHGRSALHMFRPFCAKKLLMFPSSRRIAVRTGAAASSAVCLRLHESAHIGSEWLRRRGPWRSFEQVEFATLEWVDWFNNRRLLEPIGNIPPAEAEARYYAQLDEPAIAA